jgi:uncharacterized protein (TIGR04255 family)
MSVTYNNAPLVELIAELRWGDAAGPNNPDKPPSIRLTFPESKDEEVFMQFGAVVSAHGFGRFERIVPPGFPVLSAQVACRFRPTDANQQSPLYQLGNGVFSANALPPYKSWVEFHPKVRSGIEYLFEAHRRAQVATPEFHTAVVRYIDAFRDNLSAGRNVRTFLREIMGVDLVLPDVILSKAVSPDDIRPTIQLVVPVALGRMEITFGEGMHGNQKAIVFDTTVLIHRRIGSNVDGAMQVLAEGRQLIHDVFRGLTKPIHAAMEPVE